MGMDNFSPHQQRIIKRYYRNHDAIQTQRLAELATELYLAEGKKRDRLWTQVGEILRRLEVPEPRIAHVLDRRDPALLPPLVQELQAGG